MNTEYLINRQEEFQKDKTLRNAVKNFDKELLLDIITKENLCGSMMTYSVLTGNIEIVKYVYSIGAKVEYYRCKHICKTNKYNDISEFLDSIQNFNNTITSAADVFGFFILRDINMLC